MSSNMDLFNEATASILSRHYDEFPKRVGVLKAEDVRTEATESELAVFGATAEFLLDEGFLAGGSPANSGKIIPYVRLTSKGLAVLKSIPNSISTDSSKSFAEALKNVLGTGSKQAMNTIIEELMSAYVRYRIQT